MGYGMEWNDLISPFILFPSDDKWLMAGKGT
jgi:hypothetical protein